MRNLEPRIELEGSIIFKELDEINELIFILNGTIDIGFDINKIRRYVLRFDSNYVIGAYDCTFNQKSLFVYKCKTEC